MLKIENAEVGGWEHTIRGMRNPMNSWGKSDSFDSQGCAACRREKGTISPDCESCGIYVGPNDRGLMMRLRNAGTDHRKFMRMIVVYLDITAPLYWWKEFDTYKVGTTANSCSTMHKIAAKAFALEDFSCEHLTSRAKDKFEDIIDELNHYRGLYLNGGDDYWTDSDDEDYGPKDKRMWWQMIQLLPSSYNQRRTVMLNYEVLANIYKSRRNHKLDEWHMFCDWIETLPYSKIICGEDGHGV